MLQATTKPHETARSTERKATLFCPTCGHRSPIDGDWDVYESDADDSALVYACPVCDSTLTRRPRSPSPTA